MANITKTQDITNALNDGARVLIGLSSYRGPADVAKFLAKWDEEMIGYSQVRIFRKGDRAVSRVGA